MLKRIQVKLVIALALPLIGREFSAWAQGKKPPALTELAAYSGFDREQILVTGAKSEGKVVWYTSLAGSSYKELAKGFEAKYPGIKADVYRAASSEMMAKISAETQAKQRLADTIETTLPLLKSLRDKALLVPYTSPHLAQHPATAREKADRGLFFWVIDRESYIGVGYNTNVIVSNAIPKSFADLLKPELKAKIGFTSSDTGIRMLGAMLKFKGEKFLRKLKAQELSLHSVSGRALADMAISGEIPLSPTIFRDHAIESKGKGAPINWVPMEAVPTNAGAVAIIANAPHPHAALLMADFILSPEGQKILERLEFGSPSRPLGFNTWYPEAGLNTAQYDKLATDWQKLLREIARK